MAITSRSQELDGDRDLTDSSKPRRCPCCGRPYAFRVPHRLDAAMNLGTHYRCGRHGTHVYVHEIEFEWTRFGLKPVPDAFERA